MHLNFILDLSQSTDTRSQSSVLPKYRESRDHDRAPSRFPGNDWLMEIMRLGHKHHQRQRQRDADGDIDRCT